MESKKPPRTIQPIFGLKSIQLKETDIALNSPEKKSDGTQLAKLQSKLTPKRTPVANKVIDIDKEPESMFLKYRFLIRSPNIPKDKAIEYLVVVIKGLHYSLKCLKPPSSNFINSKKIKLEDNPGNRTG